ncbi:MAG: glycosyltransferase [Pyrinomonadaceae bacterium]
MARIVLTTIGSLGDLHPMIALGLELRRRGHNVVINTWEGYREKIDALGFEFFPLRPDVDIEDTEIHRKVMDASTGPEFVIKDLMMGNIRDTYEDLITAIDGADLFISGEIVYAADAASKISGVPWISTSLAPVSMFSAEDPSIYMQSALLEMAWSLPAFFHRGMQSIMGLVMKPWLAEYRSFRRKLGLSEDHDPIKSDKFSPLLHLVMFSKALGKPQSDWPKNFVQTGACFYDESEMTVLDQKLESFLGNGEQPIVFTLGSAAVMDAGSFFDESAKAAKILGRRAVLLYGRDQKLPSGLSDEIVAFEYAPYSLVFPRAACVIHQAGVGTTGQVLRAGVPHLIMPFSHDQPDNAARCRRAGVAEVISRDSYTAETAANALKTIISDEKYRTNAAALKRIVDSESGTAAACDAIEAVLPER